MTHDLLHAQTDADLPEGMRLAYDGLVLGQTTMPVVEPRAPVFEQ